MDNSQSISEQIRYQYTLIYYWYAYDEHKSLGRLVADNIKWNRDNDNIRAYLDAIEQMPNPQTANPEQINIVAQQVRSGPLEFTCAETVNGGDNLYTIAGRISEYYLQLKAQERANKIGISYPNEETTIPTAAEYFKKATDIYSSNAKDQERNLGGSIAIADTNWEIQQIDDHGKMKYRKATELHFSYIPEEEDNLFQLATEEKISIISIQVKS